MFRMVTHGTPMMYSYLRELSKFSLVGVIDTLGG
jgi:hypothetical protein